MVLALFRAQDGKGGYPPGFHIGFIQESEERVNQINQRLQDDGYKVPKPARLHGSWTFYFKSPGGFTIEVLH
jgi:lactoylglutathione lyase